MSDELQGWIILGIFVIVALVLARDIFRTPPERDDEFYERLKKKRRGDR